MSAAGVENLNSFNTALKNYELLKIPHPRARGLMGGGETKTRPGLGSHTPTSGLAVVTRNIAAWGVRGDAE